MFFISACQEKLLLEDVFIQALRKKIFPANTEFKICLFMPLPDSSISLRPSIFTFINVLSNSYTHLSVRPVWMSLDSQSSVCALSTTTMPPSLFQCFSLVYPHAHHLAADLCYLSFFPSRLFITMFVVCSLPIGVSALWLNIHLLGRHQLPGLDCSPWCFIS